jgi:hypothetical protein
VDIAQLGLSVDSRDVVKATSDLKKLPGEADKASKSVEGLGRAAKAGFATLVTGAVSAVTALAGIYSRYAPLIDENAKLAQALGGTSTGMDALARAGGRAGVSTEELRAASQRLNQALGTAIQSGGAAAETLERLNLDAKELSKMDVDQRFAAISTRMKEMNLSTQITAMELRNLGIRQSSMITLMQGGGEAIDESRRKLELYGVAMSEVDAAKVEAANDSLSELSIISGGLAKQMTVQLAPVVDMIAVMFSEAAEEAGGMGNVAVKAFDMIIDAAAFVVDAGDGVKRVFTIIADSIIGMLVTAQRHVLDIIITMGNALDRLPGVKIDTSGLQDSSRMAQQIAVQAAASIQSAFDEPLAGQLLRDAIKRAQEMSQANAELVVSSRTARDAIDFDGADTRKNSGKTADAVVSDIDRQISAIERAAATWGMTSEQVQLFDLQTKGASASQIAYAKTLLDTVSALDAQKKAHEEIEAAMERIASPIGANQTAIGRLEEEVAQRAEVYAQAYETEYINKQEHDRLMLELEMQASAERKRILDEEHAAREASMMQTMASITQITAAQVNQMQGLFDQASGVGKAFFVMSQALAAANAVINGLQSAMAIRVAYAQMAAMNPVAAPAILSMGEIHAGVAQGMGFATAGMIVGQTVASFDGGGFTGNGSRVGGVDGKGGFPAILHPNETVIDHTKGQGMGVVINISNAPAGTSTRRRQGADGREVIDVMIGDLQSDGPFSRQLQQTFNSQRRGT